jgi:hypothetical protein
MPHAFFVDPVLKTVKLCNPNITNDLTKRVGQARYDITFSTETPEGSLVEYSRPRSGLIPTPVMLTYSSWPACSTAAAPWLWFTPRTTLRPR